MNQCICCDEWFHEACIGEVSFAQHHVYTYRTSLCRFCCFPCFLSHSFILLFIYPFIHSSFILHSFFIHSSFIHVCKHTWYSFVAFCPSFQRFYLLLFTRCRVSCPASPDALVTHAPHASFSCRQFASDAYVLLCPACSSKPLFRELFARYPALNASAVELKQDRASEDASPSPAPPSSAAVVCPFGTHPPVARRAFAEASGTSRRQSATPPPRDEERQHDACGDAHRFLLLPRGWRESLCFCGRCLALYRTFPEQYVLFDADDAQESAEHASCDDVFGEERGRDAVEATIARDAAGTVPLLCPHHSHIHTPHATHGHPRNAHHTPAEHFKALPFPVQAAVSREFRQLQRDLKEYLRVFAESGRTVTRTDIERFFAGQSAKRPRLE